MFDYVIVGAGLSGSVVAERIANDLNKKVLIIEKRNHIAGNVFDHHNEHGILVHQYGPHIFHTKLKEVWDYISQFTEWNHYHHRVLGSIDGQHVPIPFNLKSLFTLLPQHTAQQLEQKLVTHFGYNVKVPILKLRETSDEQLKWLADYVYEKIFLHYTKKQWDMTPEELNRNVTGRVPVYISNDDRYFQDTYQGLPKNGYTRVVEAMLDHQNIKLMLNTDYKEVVTFNADTGSIMLFGQPFTGQFIYTGKIDELFNYKYGELPYRSLRFEHETIEQEKYQSAGTVNYPNEYDFTRITEFKHLTGQVHPYTSIVREYPQPYSKDIPGMDIPYYPIPQSQNQIVYKQYKQKAKQYNQVVLLGRLAEYTYYDMDACIAKALKVYEQVIRGE
ncbi:UDP-galactopyranose mutase [Paenibacillus yanchengensis]|uniref:UDP-galactopyranose mutase n=1 Tax=Paenibacillus yanchengensis TaxID=2035833 RepID=A0ABW4YMQ2_9BACL